MLELDKRGTQLKYFCQKQDVILIKNLMVSAQHRWDKVAARVSERTRQLDQAFQETKDFNDRFADMCQWIDEKLNWLHEQQTAAANDSNRLQVQLKQHENFQRELQMREPAYDGAKKSGRILKDHAPKVEQSQIQDQMNLLQDKWNTLTKFSVERQQALGQALIFAGRFKDAVQQMLDWLAKVEPSLDESLPVHGDLDTVNQLSDQHKALMAELKSRAANIENIRDSAEKLMHGGGEEGAQAIQSQLNELNGKWDSVNKKAAAKDEKLADALRMV